MFHRGKPTKPTRNELTLTELREAYLTSQENKLEQTTLEGIKLHFNHLERIFGKVIVPQITRPDLQRYVNKRSDE